MSDFDNRGFIAEIECTVCLEVPNIETKILQCNNGHLFCQTCYLKLSKCPACRLILASEIENGPGPIRCLIAETIIRKLSNNIANDDQKQKHAAIKDNDNQWPFLKSKINEKIDDEFHSTKSKDDSNKQKYFGVYWGRRLPMQNKTYQLI